MNLADIDAAIATAIESLGPRSRMPSDLRDDFRSRPDDGSTLYQLRIASTGQAQDSNSVWFILAVQTIWYRMLADPTDERAYTLGQLATDLDQVLRDAWWGAIDGIASVAEGEAVEVTHSREGNVIISEITVPLWTSKE